MEIDEMKKLESFEKALNVIKQNHERVRIDCETVTWLVDTLKILSKRNKKLNEDVEIQKKFKEMLGQSNRGYQELISSLEKENERMKWALNVIKNRTTGWIEFDQFHFIAKQGLGEENCPLDWK